MISGVHLVTVRQTTADDGMATIFVSIKAYIVYFLLKAIWRPPSL